MFDPSLAELVHNGADAFVRLSHKMTIAEDIQWDQSPLSGPVDANAVHSDPVADTVADERRLAVRREYERGRARLAELTAEARAVERALDAAIADWEGR